MAFYTILTDIGMAKLANATALGTTVQLTEIAVGDGGGVAVTPDEAATELVNEVWRAALNGISIDADNDNWIVAEGYIPSASGGFTVREVALFDVDGDMIAVGNYPDTYKPTLASGSAKDLYIKVIIEVSNANTVQLKIDSAVVLSTRKYVDDNLLLKLSKDTLIGMIIPKADAVVPVGFLECDGSALSRTTYADLFAVISTTYGAGDGSTTFNIPDLRGEFIRGWDNGKGVDSGRAIGTSQTDLLKSHAHDFFGGNTSDVAGSERTYLIGINRAINQSLTVPPIGATGGTETRPRNIAMMYCIKY